MGYKKTSYSIPALTVEKSTYIYGATTVYSDWGTISIPSQSGTYYVIPEISTDYLRLIKEAGDDNWQVSCTLQLADSGSTVRVSYLLGQILQASYTGGYAGHQFHISRTYGYALVKHRLALSFATGGYVGHGCKGSCSFAGGNIHIFASSTEGTAAEVEVTKSDSWLQLANLSGGNLDKYRYKVSQTVSGIGLTWSATPVSYDGGKFISFGS